MSTPIIKVSGLSKRYRIGVKRDTHRNIRDDIVNVFTAPFRNFKRLRNLTNFDDPKDERTRDEDF